MDADNVVNLPLEPLILAVILVAVIVVIPLIVVAEIVEADNVFTIFALLALNIDELIPPDPPYHKTLPLSRNKEFLMLLSPSATGI